MKPRRFLVMVVSSLKLTFVSVFLSTLYFYVGNCLSSSQSTQVQNCESNANCIGQNLECHDGHCRNKLVQSKTVEYSKDNNNKEEFQIGQAQVIGLLVGIPTVVFTLTGIVLCCVFCPGSPLRSYQQERLQRPKGIIGFVKLGSGPHGNLMKYGEWLPNSRSVETIFPTK